MMNWVVIIKYTNSEVVTVIRVPICSILLVVITYLLYYLFTGFYSILCLEILGMISAVISPPDTSIRIMPSTIIS